jgi:hypothetical protein
VIYYGIAEFAAKGGYCFDVFPIPANIKLNIHSEFIKDKSQIELGDVYGRIYLLELQPIDLKNTYSIDVSSLSPGIYYLREPGCQQVVKVLIMR